MQVHKGWAVGAFKKGNLEYYASIVYDDRKEAYAYRDKCAEECSKATGMKYRVVRVGGE